MLALPARRRSFVPFQPSPAPAPLGVDLLGLFLPLLKFPSRAPEGVSDAFQFSKDYKKNCPNETYYFSWRESLPQLPQLPRGDVFPNRCLSSQISKALNELVTATQALGWP